MLDAILRLDTTLFLFFNAGIANSVFDRVFPVITNGMFWIVPAAAAAALFIKIQKRKSIVVLVLSIVTVGISDPICNRIIKPAVHRLRPCNPQVSIPDGRFLIGRKTSHSFPSSHAMNIFAQATLFSFFFRKRAVWFFLFASMIGFSRVYVGVHYPFDVLGGALLGACVGGLVYRSYLLIDSRRKRKKCAALSPVEEETARHTLQNVP